jgi:hypothetical protein
MSHVNPAAKVAAFDCRVQTSELTLTPLATSTIWLRCNLPVVSFADVPAVYLSRLSKTLAEGMVVQRDPSRTDFFDGVIDDTWMYFHIAHPLRLVYLVAIRDLSSSGAG